MQRIGYYVRGHWKYFYQLCQLIVQYPNNKGSLY